MNLRLETVNLFGVVALTVLCSLQWAANRRLRLENLGLEQARVAQQAELANQSHRLHQQAEELESLRRRLQEPGTQPTSTPNAPGLREKP